MPSGLERLALSGDDVSKVASVASFFISRIDTAIDQLLDDAINRTRDLTLRTLLAELKGKVAVANAKLAYRHYKDVCASPRWRKLSAQGARPQRLLWASTGTKNKSYRDVVYVEEPIGRDTVNTLPLATLEAFCDHGETPELSGQRSCGRRICACVARQAGISLDRVTDYLVTDGLQLFSNSFDNLLAAVATKVRDRRQLKTHLSPA